MREILNDTRVKYQINSHEIKPVTSKSYLMKCQAGNCFFIKKTELYTEDKFAFLKEQGITNVIYPIKNTNNKYITTYNQGLYYLTDYYHDRQYSNQYKAVKLSRELANLHHNTDYKKPLSVEFSRKKVEELYEYFRYKFSTIELFIRTVEAQPFDEYSIVILKNYQYIILGEKKIAALHKKLIEHVKSRKSVSHSFIHNNPKFNHLINVEGSDYLISIDNSKIGIPSLDIAKFYIEAEDITLDIKSLINQYFEQYDDDFYFDYFCFLVLLYYVKGININGKDYVSSQSFIYAASSIKKFIEIFLS